jgi:hypothetical protein
VLGKKKPGRKEGVGESCNTHEKRGGVEVRREGRSEEG